MTQQELADRVNRSRSAVNAWERGRSVPMRSLTVIEDVLGVQLRAPVDDRPDVVRENWDDGHVRELWELPPEVPYEQRLSLIVSYLRRRGEDEARSETG